jgi:ABC-type lipoprotein release transport system permease subunit
MRRGLLFATIGTALGLVLALGLARFLDSLICGVNAWDTETFVMVPVLLAAVALVACYLPARRATRMDAMATPRCPWAGACLSGIISGRSPQPKT